MGEDRVRSEGVCRAALIQSFINFHIRQDVYRLRRKYYRSPRSIREEIEALIGDWLCWWSHGGRMQSPGGAGVGLGGKMMVFHNGKNPANATIRQMWTGELSIEGTTVDSMIIVKLVQLIA